MTLFVRVIKDYYVFSHKKLIFAIEIITSNYLTVNPFSPGKIWKIQFFEIPKHLSFFKDS